jgi:hypothetical protein
METESFSSADNDEDNSSIDSSINQLDKVKKDDTNAITEVPQLDTETKRKMLEQLFALSARGQSNMNKAKKPAALRFSVSALTDQD